MSSAVNRVCNVESVDSETTRFEWVVGSLSKYSLGDKVTSSSVTAGRTRSVAFEPRRRASPGCKRGRACNGAVERSQCCVREAGGSKWVLDFYPRGYVMPEHASLYLNVANPEVCVCV